MEPIPGEGFATELVTTPSTPISPPPDALEGPPVSELKFQFYAPALRSRTDQAAICTASLTAGGPYALDYDFSLTSPGGNFMAVQEQTITEGRIVAVDGWWDRLLGCLQRDCGSVCIGATISCPKVNWAAFLVCLAGRCGGCVIKCAACATCDCSWWCKWAAGCCEG